ncbi:Uncharacterised protein [Mycobacteroides abscessus subsp. abscessus]|nr:Uncharacterised protein [Mycobacteroides abscessus subsp. abscessus]
MRNAEGRVAFGRPRASRCASSASFVARHNSHSESNPPDRTRGAGSIGNSCPLGRIGKWCSMISGMSKYSATLPADCSKFSPVDIGRHSNAHVVSAT